MGTFVLVHGSPSTPKSWSRLAALLNDHRVVTPSLPGHGAEDAVPPLQFTIEDRASAVLAAVALTGDTTNEVTDGPVTLVGASFGGVVAVAMALAEPARFDRLVLLEPVLLGALPVDHPANLTFERYVERVLEGERGAIATMIDMWNPTGTYASMPANVAEAIETRAVVNARDVAATLQYRPSAEELDRLPGRVEVLLGTTGQPTAPEIAASLAALVPRVTVNTVQGGSHLLAESHAAAVAEVLRGSVPA